MDATVLEDKLGEKGELMVNVTEFDEPIELHRYDTTIGDGVVKHELTDGELVFSVDEVVGYWTHYHSTADYGLE